MQASGATNSLLVVPLFLEPIMLLFELFESKTKSNKLVIPAKKPRDPNHKTMSDIAKSGAAGAHKPAKFTRKEKHKNNKERDTSVFL